MGGSARHAPNQPGVSTVSTVRVSVVFLGEELQLASTAGFGTAHRFATAVVGRLRRLLLKLRTAIYFNTLPGENLKITRPVRGKVDNAPLLSQLP